MSWVLERMGNAALDKRTELVLLWYETACGHFHDCYWTLATVNRAQGSQMKSQ